MSTISASTTSTTAYKVTADTTGALVLQTGATPTTAVTIDTSGNVKLSIAGTVIQNSSGRPMVAQTGGVLQVVQGTYAVQSSTSSSTASSTGITASITPSTTSSKILILATVGASYVTSGSQGVFYIYRGGSQLGGTACQLYGAASAVETNNSFEYLDSPATTSSTTYTIYLASNTGTIYSCVNGTTSTITLLEIAA